MLTISGTGHRPQALAPSKQDAFSPVIHERLVDLAKAALVKYDVGRVYTGMALGWDQALAEAAAGLGVPFYAFVPFEGFEAVWPDASKARYFRLLDLAAGRKTICKPGYAAWKLQRRNEALVDLLPEDGLLLALYNGVPKGGTFNCLQYARQRQRRIINLWPSWEANAGYSIIQEDAGVLSHA